MTFPYGSVGDDSSISKSGLLDIVTGYCCARLFRWYSLRQARLTTWNIRMADNLYFHHMLSALIQNLVIFYSLISTRRPV